MNNNNSGYYNYPNQQQYPQQQNHLPNQQMPLMPPQQQFPPQQPFPTQNAQVQPFTPPVIQPHPGYQQQQQQQQQQFYQMSSSSSSNGGHGVTQQQQYQQQQYSNVVQNANYAQQKQGNTSAEYSSSNYSQSIAQGQPTSTVITSQIFYSDSKRMVSGNPSYAQPQQPMLPNFPPQPPQPQIQPQHHHHYQQPQPPQPQQQMYQPEFDQPQSQNQLVLAQPKQFYTTPTHGSFSSLANSEFTQSRPGSARPMSRSSSTASLDAAPKTSILSHSDGSLMLQEIFVISGTLDDLTGYAHALDLQGIWARVRPSGSSTSHMRLALRMLNSGSTTRITNLTMKFAPNSFGLVADPSVSLLAGVKESLEPGQTANCNLNLICAPENQRIGEDRDLSACQINISYQCGSNKFHIVHRTFIPLHIFFVDHPQADPTNYVSDPDTLSCTDDGPRLTQSVFLSLWPSDMPSHFFTFENVNWKRWYTSYAQAGVLSAITGVTFPTANPSVREVIKVFERKMSTNRVYVVASREVQTPGVQGSSLVFFCSFKVGELPGGGVLLLGEVKMTGDDWSKCEVKLKSTVNRRLWGGLERAVRAILLS